MYRIKMTTTKNFNESLVLLFLFDFDTSALTTSTNRLISPAALVQFTTLSHKIRNAKT